MDDSVSKIYKWFIKWRYKSGKKLKYFKRPIYRDGKKVYKAYVAIDYLDKGFDIYCYIKKKFWGLFWIKVMEGSGRNKNPKQITKEVITQFENSRKKEKYHTHKLSTHIINFLNWDGELNEKPKSN